MLRKLLTSSLIWNPKPRLIANFLPISNKLHNSSFKNGNAEISISSSSKNMAQNSLILLQTERHYSSSNFYNRLTAKDLWKSETSVSKVGAKRGRAAHNRRPRIINLNRGQKLGHGKINMVWPGLNTRIFEKSRMTKQKELPPDPEYWENVMSMRSTYKPGQKKGHFSVDPLERGWAGKKLPGRKVGPPQKGVGFENFETIVLESRLNVSMDSRIGRKKMHQILVVTGNGNGSIGFAQSMANFGKDALRKAVNQAGQRLFFIDRCEGRTIYHNFHTTFNSTEIMVKRTPIGYGLKCHRVITALCQAIGIKDLYAKIEGSTNTMSIVKAFLLGLLNQRTHQQLAEEKGLHIVRIDSGFLPTVLASPVKTPLRSKEDIPRTEELDYDLVTLGGRVPLVRPEEPPFYTKLPCYQNHLKKLNKNRNHEQIRHDLRVEHGVVKSFLHEEYPECIENSQLLKTEEEN